MNKLETIKFKNKLNIQFSKIKIKYNSGQIEWLV